MLCTMCYYCTDLGNAENGGMYHSMVFISELFSLNWLSLPYLHLATKLMLVFYSPSFVLMQHKMWQDRLTELSSGLSPCWLIGSFKEEESWLMDISSLWLCAWWHFLKCIIIFCCVRSEWLIQAIVKMYGYHLFGTTPFPYRPMEMYYMFSISSWLTFAFIMYANHMCVLFWCFIGVANTKVPFFGLLHWDIFLLVFMLFSCT